MSRNSLKKNISEFFFGLDTGTRRVVRTRAEELATIRGDWLHKGSASDFEAAGRQVTKAAAKHI